MKKWLKENWTAVLAVFCFYGLVYIIRPGINLLSAWAVVFLLGVGVVLLIGWMLGNLLPLGKGNKDE